jgi:hypothetical protein
MPEWRVGVIAMEVSADNRSIMTATPRGAPRRLLRFEDVEVRQPTSGSFACRVTLSGSRDRVFMGEGTSVVLGVPMTAAARATLRAIEAYADARFTLESIRKTNVGDRDLILVIVTASTRPRLELTGAVVVRGDESRAAALAVLDATNRWLELHSRQEYDRS